MDTTLAAAHAEATKRSRPKQNGTPAPQSQFEPGIVKGSEARVSAEEMPAQAVLDEPAKIPAAIVLADDIGWSENNSLCMFREGQMVTNPADIKRLIQHGAQYMVVTPS